MDRSPHTIDCPGCGATVAFSAGPTHQHMDAAPSCWATFTRVLNTSFDDEPSPDIRQLIVDAYAAQHPGTASPQTTHALVGHLLGLHLSLDKNTPARDIVQMIRQCRRIVGPFQSFSHPARAASLTIHDVTDAQTNADHRQRVRIWASSVWKSWSEHHRAIEEIVREANI